MSGFKGIGTITCYNMQLQQVEETLIVLLHGVSKENYILNLKRYWELHTICPDSSLHWIYLKCIF